MYFLIRTDPSKAPQYLDTTLRLWGHVIHLEKYGTFIVDHRHNMADPNERYIGYAITEPKTGMMCNIGDSVKESIDGLLIRLHRPREAKRFHDKIAEWTKEHGILNEVES